MQETRDDGLEARVAAVRRFNRFYTRRIGALDEGHLASPFSLSEARVIHELARHGEAAAAEVGRELGLDPGYLSRMLRGFRRRGLVEGRRSDADRRRSLLRLTAAGREAFARLDTDARADVGAMLRDLPEPEQRRVVGAMETIRRALDPSADDGPPFRIRAHRAGDLGWIVQRHGVLYEREYGWDATFEALVAGIAADFLRRFDPERERCWIAERNGENVGSVLLVRHPDAPETVARLRLLLVEPEARGLGVGRRLVEECVEFARGAGYATLTLWTNDVLHAARRIYEATGFRLVREEPHHSFGHDLVAQTWEMEL